MTLPSPHYNSPCPLPTTLSLVVVDLEVGLELMSLMVVVIGATLTMVTWRIGQG